MSLSILSTVIIFFSLHIALILSFTLVPQVKLTSTNYDELLFTSKMSMTSISLSRSTSSHPYRIAIIGGGTSGFFAAIIAAKKVYQIQKHQSEKVQVEITVYEAMNQVLRNIHHDKNINLLFDPVVVQKTLREMITMGYPRGSKQIMSLLTTKFPPPKQSKWFEDRGVTFATANDGKIFVDGDTSNKVYDVLLNEAVGANVKIRTSCKIRAISKNNGDHEYFALTEATAYEEKSHDADCIILATGNSHLGLSLVKSLNHKINRPFRSSFGLELQSINFPLQLPKGTYEIPNARLTIKTKIPGQKRPRIFKKQGAVKVFVGDNSRVYLSGVTTLYLTSFAAPELQKVNYKGSIFLHFCPDITQVERIYDILWNHRQDKNTSNQRIADKCPLINEEIDYDNYDFETETFPIVKKECIPRCLWENMCFVACDLSKKEFTWSQMSPKRIRNLADLIVGYELKFDGRFAGGKNNVEQEDNDESPLFINGGGISLNEVDLNKMESKNTKGLYFCGQILDGDGANDNFTFMRDFGTAYIAGKSAVDAAVNADMIDSNKSILEEA